eukprot:11205978-Lingulodinium_polyedra.AAC.1
MAARWLLETVSAASGTPPETCLRHGPPACAPIVPKPTITESAASKIQPDGNWPLAFGWDFARPEHVLTK